MALLTQIYPLDAVFDTPDDVPEAVKTNKRYAGLSGYTISEVRHPQSSHASFCPLSMGWHALWRHARLQAANLPVVPGLHRVVVSR